jgi:predicted  nucleic acid-binding Zn-ribbon protein
MQLELLYRIQEMEKKERELQQSLKSLPQFKDLKKIKEKFTHCQKRLETTKECYTDISRRLKSAEDRARVMEEKQNELNRLLYAGTVKNSKELENITQQIKNLGEQISQASDEIIKMMEEKDSIGKELGEIEHELRVQYQDFNKLKLQYNQVKLNLEQEAKAIEADKKEVLSLLDQASLIWYERSKEKFNGTPVAKVMENHACSGCRTLIPITIVKEARTSPGSVCCEKCGRILYAPCLKI